MAEAAEYTPRLKKFYEETVRPALVKEFGYKNPMQVPRIDKIVLNMGVGEAVADSKKVNSALGDLGKIAGQKAAVTKSRKSIATFKLRAGTSGRRLATRAASSPRRRRFTCRTSRSPTMTASRRGSGSASTRTAARCASPSARET